jgi:hypothetical protein
MTVLLALKILGLWIFLALVAIINGVLSETYNTKHFDIWRSEDGRENRIF